MRKHASVAKGILTALAVMTLWFGPLRAGEEADLFAQLAQVEDPQEGARLAEEIAVLWRQSGSAVIDLLYARAQSALEAGDPITAAEHLTAAIDHAPEFWAAYALRAEAYYLSGQIGPALDDLAFVLAQEPRHFEAWAGLAAVSEEIGRKETAQAAYLRLAEIYPSMEGVQDALARLSGVSGQAL